MNRDERHNLHCNAGMHLCIFATARLTELSMIFRSPYADVQIPNKTFHEVILRRAEQHDSPTALSLSAGEAQMNQQITRRAKRAGLLFCFDSMRRRKRQWIP